jgi:hypothetical protein
MLLGGDDIQPLSWFMVVTAAYADLHRSLARLTFIHISRIAGALPRSP